VFLLYAESQSVVKVFSKPFEGFQDWLPSTSGSSVTP
jgi:hypothetical protein